MVCKMGLCFARLLFSLHVHMLSSNRCAWKKHVTCALTTYHGTIAHAIFAFSEICFWCIENRQNVARTERYEERLGPTVIFYFFLNDANASEIKF